MNDRYLNECRFAFSYAKLMHAEAHVVGNLIATDPISIRDLTVTHNILETARNRCVEAYLPFKQYEQTNLVGGV